MKDDLKFWKKDISRRAFLKWSGAVGGAAVVGSSLAHYAPKALAQTTPEASKLPFGADSVTPVKCGCGDVCGMYHMGNAYVKDGVIVYYDGCEEAENKGGLCPRGISAMQVIYSPDRVKYPMKRLNEKGVPGKFERISWDAAYDLIAQKMVDAINGPGAETVAFDSGHSMSKTTDVMVSRLRGMFGFGAAGGAHGCWADLAFGPWFTLGDYYHFHTEDFHYSKLIVVWGHNKAIAMPSEFADGIMEAKNKYGAKIVVIDPRYTETAEKADLYLPVRPGTDAALALGLANVIITEGLYDADFVAKYTVGFDQFREIALQYTPEKVEEITWCPADRIRQLARWYATIKPAVLEFGRGGNYVGGNAGWLCSRVATCLLGLTGQVGVRGAGYSVEMSVYSPSNTAFWFYPSGSFAWTKDPITKAKSATVSSKWTQAEIMYDQKPYGYQVLWARTDLVGKNQETDRLEKAFKKIPFVVVEQRFINYTASQFADVVLPNALWTEQAMVMNEYTHMVATGPAVKPMFESKPTWLAQAELADKICEKLGVKLSKEEVAPWRTDEAIMNQWFTNKELPLGGYPNLNYQEAIKHPHGYRLPRYYNQEGFIPYHIDNDPTKDLYFPTPSGKIEFVAERLAEYGLPILPIHEEPAESPISTPELFKEYPLISHTRAHRHWTFLGYNLTADGGPASPLIREAFETAKEPTIELNPRTAKALGLKAGDMVWAESKWGKVKGKLILSERTPPQMAVTPYSWGGHQSRINPLRLSLKDGIMLPMVGQYGEGKKWPMGGQMQHVGIPVKVYKA
jgi:anaerobic selenocysteine-containing dehydrogenase